VFRMDRGFVFPVEDSGEGRLRCCHLRRRGRGAGDRGYREKQES
jgi:hypothetical protein